MRTNDHIAVEVTEIRGPNHFWVVPLHEERCYAKQMIKLRKEMKQHFENPYSRNHLDENVVYRKGDIVAVKYINTSKLWERAKIENISEPGFGDSRYVEVFLIDRGKKAKILDIASNVRPILNSTWLHIEAQAKELFLAGLMPISKDFNYLELKMKSIISTKWSELANLLIKDLIALTDEIYIQITTKEDIDEKKILKRLCGYMKLNMNIGDPVKLQQLIDKYASKKVYLKKYFNQANIELVSVHQLLIKGRFCIQQNEENIAFGQTGDNINKLESMEVRGSDKRVVNSRLSEILQLVDEKENTKSALIQQPHVSAAHGSSTERLMRWPQLENSNEYGSSNNLEPKTEEVSTPYSSSVDRLLLWPLGEGNPEPKTIQSLSASPNSDTNQSSSYHTAEGSGLKHDQSLIIAGNLIHQCK